MGNKQATLTDGNSDIQPEDFEFLKLVGQGGFGKVYQVRKRDTGEIFAMKIMQKVVVVRTNMIQHTNLEAEIMGCFGEHPFLCKLYYSFQTEDKLCFVLEYLNGGSLWTHLSEADKPFSEELVRFYCQEIVVALETLHKHDIVYRDLKLENILLDTEGHVRLTDFGLSHKLVKRKNVHSFSGTPAYIAPEILMDQGKGHGKSVDFWSFGVLIHLMLTQEPPFWSEDHQTLYMKIMKDKVLIKNAEELSPESVSLLRGLLTRDAKHRLGVCSPLRDHPFFASTNWDWVLQKNYHPPFKPHVEGPYDYRFFVATEPVDTVANHPYCPEPGTEKYPSLSSGIQSKFKGFKFLPTKEWKQNAKEESKERASSPKRKDGGTTPRRPDSREGREGATSPRRKGSREGATTPRLKDPTSPRK